MHPIRNLVKSILKKQMTSGKLRWVEKPEKLCVISIEVVLQRRVRVIGHLYSALLWDEPLRYGL